MHTHRVSDGYTDICDITKDGKISYNPSYTYIKIDKSDHLVPAWELMENDEEREIFARGAFRLVGSIGHNDLKQAKNETSWLVSLSASWRKMLFDSHYEYIYAYLPEVYSVWKILYDNQIIEYDHALYQMLQDLSTINAQNEDMRVLSELIKAKWIEILKEIQTHHVVYVDTLRNLLPEKKPVGHIVCRVSRPTLDDVRSSYKNNK